MMDFLSILILIVAYGMQGIFVSLYNSNREGDDLNKSGAYSAVMGIVVSFITLVFIGFDFKFSTISLLLGVINGFAIMLYTYFLGRGSNLGPYSFLIICALSGGIFFPLAMSLFMGETPKVVNLVGIGVMFVAFAFLCLDFSEKVKPKKGYYLSCVGIAVANGTFSVISALEERIEGGEYNKEFIIISYLSVSVLAMLILLFKNRSNVLAQFRISRKALLFMLLGATCITVGINFLMICFKFVNEAVLYTVQNGGVLVLSAFMSLLIFKEKITLQKWCGIAIATVSMVLLAI